MSEYTYKILTLLFPAIPLILTYRKFKFEDALICYFFMVLGMFSLGAVLNKMGLLK